MPKAKAKPLLATRGLKNDPVKVSLKNVEEVHVDHVLRNILGPDEPSSSPDDPTEAEVKEMKPNINWSMWADDASFRAQILFEH